MKKRGILLIVVILLAIVSVVRITSINGKEKNIVQEYYKMGEEVEIGKNIFLDDIENADGYTITVESAELLDYVEYLEKYDIEKEMADSIFGEETNVSFPEKIVDVMIKVKNTNTEDDYEKGIVVYGYLLADKDCRLKITLDLFYLANPTVTSSIFGLRAGTEKEFSVPFYFHTKDKVDPISEKRVLNGNFSLAVSLYPVQKNIQINVKN